MNTHYRNQMTVLISFVVCVVFLVTGTRSAGVMRRAVAYPALVAVLAPPEVRRYQIDAGQSHFMVHAFVGGLLSGFGHNHNIAIKEISGEAQFTDGTVAPASLQMKVRADSLSVTDKVSDSDRQTIEKTMRDDVLEIGKYPEITFQSTKIEATKTPDGLYQARIWGDLTLHGVTHNILISAPLTFDSKSLHARGEFSLKMTDYSIKPPSVAGGTIKVKDALKFTFDIAAH